MSKGTKMAKLNGNSRAKIRDYILLHLASVGKEASEIGEEMLEDGVCPGDKPWDVEQRRVILRERLVNVLGYIAEGARNLYIEAVIARRAGEKKPGQ